MKQKLKFIINSIIILMSLVLYSCEKASIVPNQDIEEDKFFEVVNNILVFKSDSSFRIALDNIASLNDNERMQWETEIGFRSQRRIVSELILQEIEYDDYLESKYKAGEITLDDD